MSEGHDTVDETDAEEAEDEGTAVGADAKALSMQQGIIDELESGGLHGDRRRMACGVEQLIGAGEAAEAKSAGPARELGANLSFIHACFRRRRDNLEHPTDPNNTQHRKWKKIKHETRQVIRRADRVYFD